MDSLYLCCAISSEIFLKSSSDLTQNGKFVIRASSQLHRSPDLQAFNKADCESLISAARHADDAIFASRGAVVVSKKDEDEAFFIKKLLGEAAINDVCDFTSS